MKKLFDLMKVDLINMNGEKNNMKTLAVAMIVFCGGMGFLISPIAGVFCPFLMGTFFVNVEIYSLSYGDFSGQHRRYSKYRESCLSDKRYGKSSAFR